MSGEDANALLHVFAKLVASHLRSEVLPAAREQAQQAVREMRAGRESAGVESSVDLTTEFLSVAEAAELAKWSTATVRARIKQGMLKRYGPKRACRVRRDEFLAMLAAEGQAANSDHAEDLAVSILSRKRR